VLRSAEISLHCAEILNKWAAASPVMLLVAVVLRVIGTLMLVAVTHGNMYRL
jgi:hypothetical protein